MFSFVCVSPSMWPLSIMHWTLLYSPPPLPPTHIGPHWTGSPASVLSGGHHWRPVQTCSLLDPPTGAGIWWLFKYHDRRKRAVRILLECFLVLLLHTFGVWILQSNRQREFWSREVGHVVDLWLSFWRLQVHLCLLDILYYSATADWCLQLTYDPTRKLICWVLQSTWNFISFIK